MVASETTCTTAVMFPLRELVEHDVANRAFCRTTPTVDTHIGVNGELLVSNHETVEVSTDNMAEHPRHRPQRQLTVTRLFVNDHLDESIQVMPGLLDLLTFTFRLVRVHKRQTDITLRHDERPNALQVDALPCQFLCQHLHCQTRVVATGAQRVAKMA